MCNLLWTTNVENYTFSYTSNVTYESGGKLDDIGSNLNFLPNWFLELLLHLASLPLYYKLYVDDNCINILALFLTNSPLPFPQPLFSTLNLSIIFTKIKPIFDSTKSKPYVQSRLQVKKMHCLGKVQLLWTSNFLIHLI